MKKFLFISLGLSVVIYLMFAAANAYDLFWHVSWYDIPMHFLGGAVLGSLGVWLFGTLNRRFPLKFTNFTVSIAVFLFVIFGSILWELQEYYSGNTFNTVGSYPLDTVKDLVMDMLGYIVIYGWYLWEKRINDEKVIN